MKHLKIFNNQLTQNSVSSADELVLSYLDSNFNEIIKKIPDSSVDEINLYQLYPNDSISTQLFRILKPKSKVSFHYCIKDRESGQALSTDLKIQGFEDIMVAKDTSTEDRFLVCRKPEFDFTAAVPIKINLNGNNSIQENEKKTWKMALNELADDDLIDENDLLKDDIVTISKDTPTNIPSDCGTGNAAAGKKRACANCSCGLAELEQQENTPNSTVEVVAKSACGNCFKGDAFRCGGCPFLGKVNMEFLHIFINTYIL